MSTSVKAPRTARAFVPQSALAKSVRFDDDMMWVDLTDGRVLGVPLEWFPVLHAAAPEQRANVEIGARGLSLHWEELDEDLSVAGLMAGADNRST